jgi:invasion protein IalB
MYENLYKTKKSTHRKWQLNCESHNHHAKNTTLHQIDASQKLFGKYANINGAIRLFNGLPSNER